MALNLTDEQKRTLMLDVESAEPYDYNSPEMNTFDGESDFRRWKATCAKILLEQDEKEKAETKNEKDTM